MAPEIVISFFGITSCLAVNHVTHFVSLFLPFVLILSSDKALQHLTLPGFGFVHLHSQIKQ